MPSGRTDLTSSISIMLKSIAPFPVRSFDEMANLARGIGRVPSVLMVWRSPVSETTRSINQIITTKKIIMKDGSINKQKY